MRILVTGGAGFLGANLVERLLEQGHSVVVVDNLITSSGKNLEDFSGNGNFVFLKMGVEGPEFKARFLDSDEFRFERIFHLACPVGVPNISVLGEEILETCSTGTKNVLLVAKKNNARMLYTSSCEVYGEPQVTPQGEDYSGNVHPQGERANYEEGKRFGETLLSMFVKKYELWAVTVRPFNVYGPRMDLSDQRVVPRFILQALEGEPLTIHGKGEQTRTMCFVSDLIDGLLLIIERGASGQIYNVGSDQEITMLELAKKVLAVSGSKSEISFVPRFSHDHNARRPKLDNIRFLGWERKVEVEDGLRQTLEFFASQKKS